MPDTKGTIHRIIPRNKTHQFGGHPLQKLYEVAGYAKSYDYIWSLVGKHTFSVENIKRMHQLFYSQIDSEKAGQYRGSNTAITDVPYPVSSWQEIPREMEEFEDWCHVAAQDLHPVLYAAERHQRFVSISIIHPFIAGNGQVAGLLMNLPLLQDSYEILTIPPVFRMDYLSFFERGHKDPHLSIHLLLNGSSMHKKT